MNQKQKDTNQKSKPASAPQPGKSSNRALFWILGGCLVLIVVGGLILAGIAYWSYKKVREKAKENQPRLEQLQSQLEKMNEEAKNKAEQQTESNFEEEPQTAPPSGGDAGILPENSERQMGFIKKVYAKGGKNYLNIDYIQWLTGDAAEKAMREDGECPEAGECVVLDDYYIRNQNPLIRTFEIDPSVQVFMQTYSFGEVSGDISWNQPITYVQFKNIFTGSAKPHLKDVPYIVEIQNQKIVKITEQYVP